MTKLGRKSQFMALFLFIALCGVFVPKIVTWCRHESWKHDVATVGKKCAPTDYQCRLNAISDLRSETLSDSVVLVTKRKLANDLWRRTTNSLKTKDYVSFVSYASTWEDTTLVQSISERYFSDKQPTFAATLRHFTVLYSEVRYTTYFDDYYWRKVTVDQAIPQLARWDDYRELLNWGLTDPQKETILNGIISLSRTWAQCDTILSNYRLSDSQADAILGRSLRLAQNDSLEVWWNIYCYASGKREQRRGQQSWQKVDNPRAQTAADGVIARATDLDYLISLAPHANNRQILAMVQRLNTWPKLTAGELIEWISQLKDQSLAYRVLQDQANRRTAGELVDAYNKQDDSPVKNWIIDILRQRNPTMQEWNEIYLRSKEGSRLMTLAAIGSLRCDK